MIEPYIDFDLTSNYLSTS